MGSRIKAPGPGPSSPTPSIKHSSKRSQREEFWNTVLDTSRNSTISPSSRSVKKSSAKIFYATPLPLSPEAAAALGISPEHLRLPSSNGHEHHSPSYNNNTNNHHNHHQSASSPLLHLSHHKKQSSSKTSTATTTPMAMDQQQQSNRRASRSERKSGPFICETCNSSYSQKGDMVRHMRSVHQGIRPYRCPHCGNAFGRRSILNKHVKTHMKNNN